MRSARTDSPRRIGRKLFSGEEEAAAAATRGGGGSGSLLKCWTWIGPTGPGPTDEHSVHLHHRDFIVTPIADQIEPIDSVSKTEYYNLQNHFSEPQCKKTVLPLNSGKPRIGYPRMSASGESSTTMHRLLHASGSHPIPTPYDPKYYSRTRANTGSSIDHQVTIYLHAQNITTFPTNETWYFASQILFSNSGGLILILTAQSTRNMFRIHSPNQTLEEIRPAVTTSPETRRSGGRSAAPRNHARRKGARPRAPRSGATPLDNCRPAARDDAQRLRNHRRRPASNGATMRASASFARLASSSGANVRTPAAAPSRNIDRPPRISRAASTQRPRPDSTLLRQPALEGLTRSTRTDSPRRIGRKQFSGEEEAAAAARGGGGGGSLLKCWTWTGPTGPGPTDEHSVHLHHRDFIVTPIADQIGPIDSVSNHRDFIVTPIADQIGPIDSVSKTEYYNMKNHFSEPQCKRPFFPSTAGNPGITDSACKNHLVVVSVQYGPFNPYISIRSTTIGKSRVAIDPIAMHTSWRSNSDIASVTRIGYPRMSASGESSTTMHRLLHASGSHPIPTPYDPKTTGVSNPIRSPSFRLSVSLSAQQSAFAVGVLSDLYTFHRSTGNSLCPYRTPAW
ncbi:hypothetical protein F511_06123 [Dorcoceras hygrometricum]|uniref:Uncharacterized protein n=1 Tax=Dorcoceras hygrometricum TaxID=472368 RepID=A0A2Z7BHE2_9LAMI|nr:hypothetical protein F511_06123 [Dorcoceras hygrometricum]